jgi:LSD1 subclass zinc finger protein
MAQLCCSNAQCRVVLMYPRGAGAVQCSVCGNISDASQANQLGHIVCGGCHVTLAYAYGAQSVKCAVCNFVTPAAAAAGAGAGAAALPQTQQSAVAQQQQPAQPALTQQSQQQQPTKTVVVENPTGDGEVRWDSLLYLGRCGDCQSRLPSPVLNEVVPTPPHAWHAVAKRGDRRETRLSTPRARRRARCFFVLPALLVGCSC